MHHRIARVLVRGWLEIEQRYRGLARACRKLAYRGRVIPRAGLLRRWLTKATPAAFSLYCILAAFGTYFCVYAYRKPFTAATFDGLTLGSISLKTLYLGSQVAGYTVSKFIGIRVVSEMPAHRRCLAIVGLIAIAELALLLFAITPAPVNAVWLFVNGLPLGMVFGMVLAFLEGRRMTEVLTAGLCASFILSSGVLKSVGQTLVLKYGVSEMWMPVTTGFLFVPLLLLCVYLLGQIPPPDDRDIAQRARREPMLKEHRIAFFRRHWVGVLGLIIVFLLLTIGRSLRDDFAVEIWRDLGIESEPSVYASTETVVMFGVLLLTGIGVYIRSNRRAFLASLVLSIAGFGILAVSTILQGQGHLKPFAFMALSGLGLYVPYVAFHTTVFERLIATFRERANIGYLMYLADAFGYLGYVAVLLLRNVTESIPDHLQLYKTASLWIAGLPVLGVALVAVYFSRQMREEPMLGAGEAG